MLNTKYLQIIINHMLGETYNEIPPEIFAEWKMLIELIFD